jgi:O-antigen/teichoic acid export membrane protein
MYLGLQVVNIIVGLFITLYIAQNVDVETFAIFAIFAIVTSLFRAFSFLGYETVLIRNLLHWKNIKQYNKINNLISYAIFSRIVMGLILFLPILLYLYYISLSKFENEHFILFVSFTIAGFFSALTNANGLILKAFNRYILSFSIMTLSSLVGKSIAIFVFIKIGFYGFIITLILIPIVSFFISFLYLKQYFSFNLIKIKYFSKYKRYQYFAFSGYLNFFKVSIDQFLISIMLSVEVLAVYNLAKKIEETGRSAVEGFFDPMIQKIVGYKGDIEGAINYKKKIYFIKNIFLIMTILIVLVFNLYVDNIISLAKLEHYPNLNIYMIISSWTPVLYLIYKIQSNIIYLFDDQKVLFKIDLFIGLMTTSVAIIFFMLISEEYIYLNRIVVGIVAIVFFTYFYKYQFYKKLWGR